MGLPGWYALWSPALSFWSLGASADEVGPGPLRAAGGGGAALLGALFCPAEVRDGILGASRDGASEKVDGRQERKEDGGLDRGGAAERAAGALSRCRVRPGAALARAGGETREDGQDEGGSLRLSSSASASAATTTSSRSSRSRSRAA